MQDILKAVLTAVWEEPQRRFVWSEISFFRMFYEEYRGRSFRPGPDPVLWSTVVKELVREKRFEFVGGGAVQNDEACVDIEGVLMQVAADAVVPMHMHGVCMRRVCGCVWH